MIRTRVCGLLFVAMFSPAVQAQVGPAVPHAFVEWGDQFRSQLFGKPGGELALHYAGQATHYFLKGTTLIGADGIGERRYIVLGQHPDGGTVAYDIDFAREEPLVSAKSRHWKDLSFRQLRWDPQSQHLVALRGVGESAELLAARWELDQELPDTTRWAVIAVAASVSLLSQSDATLTRGGLKDPLYLQNSPWGRVRIDRHEGSWRFHRSMLTSPPVTPAPFVAVDAPVSASGPLRIRSNCAGEVWCGPPEGALERIGELGRDAGLGWIEVSGRLEPRVPLVVEVRGEKLARSDPFVALVTHGEPRAWGRFVAVEALDARADRFWPGSSRASARTRLSFEGTFSRSIVGVTWVAIRGPGEPIPNIAAFGNVRLLSPDFLVRGELPAGTIGDPPVGASSPFPLPRDDRLIGGTAFVQAAFVGAEADTLAITDIVEVPIVAAAPAVKRRQVNWPRRVPEVIRPGSGQWGTLATDLASRIGALGLAKR